MNRWVLLLALLNITGCASLQVGNEARVIEASPDLVFDAALRTLQAEGFKIALADSVKRTLVTERRPRRWQGRRPEQVRIGIDSLGARRARVRLFIAFADDVSDGPRKRRPRRKKRGTRYNWSQTPVGQFFTSSSAYDALLDAIACRVDRDQYELQNQPINKKGPAQKQGLWGIMPGDAARITPSPQSALAAS